MQDLQLLDRVDLWLKHCERVNHIFKDEPLKTRQTIAFIQLDAFGLDKQDVYALAEAGIINQKEVNKMKDLQTLASIIFYKIYSSFFMVYMLFNLAYACYKYREGFEWYLWNVCDYGYDGELIFNSARFLLNRIYKNTAWQARA